MRLTQATVADERARIRDEEQIPGLINDVRDRLGPLFGVEVDHVDADVYRDEVDAVFADGDRGVNVACLSMLLRELDCPEDYPGFVVDEFLGRQLSSTVAGGQPLALLAEATFHFADVHVHGGDAAGTDDRRAALAAGFQTRLPGWAWRESPSPFAVDPE